MNVTKDRFRPLFLMGLFILLTGLVILPAGATAPLHGRNMDLGRIDSLKKSVGSLNWGGYVGATDFTNPSAAVTTVTASWTVQSAARTQTATYSSQWTGIGGYFSSDSSLIQLGTESDYYRNAAHYYAWIEMLPNSEQVISLTVKPGDKIVASITPGTGTNAWVMSITDVTTGKSYTTPVSYASSMLSGEYIEERPEMCNAFSCTLTSLANFGTAYFGYDYTKQANTDYLTVNGASKALGSVPWQSVTMYANNGKTQIAIPSSLSTDGTSFTMKYSSGTSHGSFGAPSGSPAQWGVGEKTVESAPGPLDHMRH